MLIVRRIYSNILMLLLPWTPGFPCGLIYSIYQNQNISCFAMPAVDQVNHKRKPEMTDSAKKPPKERCIKQPEDNQQINGDCRETEDESQEEQPLTDTIKLGLLGMQTQEEAIMHKIDELMAAGSSFLDNLKEQFLNRLEKVKDEVREFCAGQASEWSQASLETLAAQERLVNAQMLVHRLGLKAANESSQTENTEPCSAV